MFRSHSRDEGAMQPMAMDRGGDRQTYTGQGFPSSSWFRKGSISIGHCPLGPHGPMTLR